MKANADIVLGIDVGGTFTDVIALDISSGQVVAVEKLPSTSDEPAKAALEGLRRVQSEQLGQRDLRTICHGTTVGTNALIEKKGARIGLITTRGFRDVLALRRQARPRLYDLKPRVVPTLVEAPLRLEISARRNARGQVINALDERELEQVVAALVEAKVEAIAICLLHAYADASDERRVAAAIDKHWPNTHGEFPFVSCSSDVCAEFREFERTSTVVVNAYIGPAVSRYLNRLDELLREEAAAAQRHFGPLAIVKSNGGLSSIHNATRFPVHLIESGPAAGVIATAALGHCLQESNLIAFDMGGTTAKVGVVVDGLPRMTTEFQADQFVDGRDVGGYPIKSPVIDLIEIGAGGGSLAWVDELGLLQVGPQSAGAFPGPACYGRGGVQATVTDAHVVLGHIDPHTFGARDLQLCAESARQVVDSEVAKPLGLTVEQAAHGILTIATARMCELVRLATLRRGLDPRDFSLVAFGGAGGLHACDIAEEVGIPRVLIPPMPGLFSSIGATLAERRHDLVQSVLIPLSALETVRLEEVFAALRHRAQNLIDAEAVASEISWTFAKQVDLRFEGQLFELPIVLHEQLDATRLEQQFRQRYRALYGYDLSGHPVELVNARLVARQPSPAHARDAGIATVAGAEGEGRAAKSTRQIVSAAGTMATAECVRRSALVPGIRLSGPLVIEDVGSTILVRERQNLEVLGDGTLALELRATNE